MTKKANSPTRAKRDPESTRAAILEAAEEVFLEEGVARASTSKIASRAGVTKSLIHHHFDSKDKLWGEVKNRRISRYFEGQLELIESSEPDSELLRRSFGYFFQFLKENPQVVRIMAWMYLEQDDDCSELDKEVHQAGVEKIREAQEAGHLRADVNPEVVLFVFIALVQYWFQARDHFCADMQITAAPEEMDAPYLENMMKIFFEGVLPR